MRARRSVSVLAALVVLGGGVAAGAANRSSVRPDGGSAERPGPPILYAKPSVAPQLQNTGVWHAQPILISGTSAYRDGEYLYQDYLYDDHGARESQDPNDPRGNNQFSGPNGTYTYPTSDKDANGADFVEVRVKSLPYATAFRFTLNSLAPRPDVAISVALGGEAGEPHAFPFGANTSAPAKVFLTLKPESGGMASVITSAATGKELGGSPLVVHVDQNRRQISAWVPHDYWNPGENTERIAAAVGLWDRGHELASLRNIPTMVWDVVPVDELNPYSEVNVVALQQLGYRYDYLAFPGEHLTPAINDDYAEAVAFLGTARVDPDPAHVTYVYGKDTLDGLVRSTGDFPKWGVVADHAYWLSDLRPRTAGTSCQGSQTPGCGTTASIDAMSAGFGVGDPAASGPQPGANVQTGGAAFPVLPYLEVKQTWSTPPQIARTDDIALTATNLAAATIDVARAHVDCNVTLHVTTDGPLTVVLAGCSRLLHFG